MSPQPDIILIVTDQQHADAIGALGMPGLRTPTMDALVAAGTTFTSAYCASPLCSPSRAAMITGRTPCETGVIENNIGIRAGVPTLGEILGQQGYRCAYAGKWHVPRAYTRDIPGFDVIATGHQHHGTMSDAGVTEGCVRWLAAHADDPRPLCLVVSYMQPHDVCNWLRHNQIEPAQPRYPEILGDLPPLPANRQAIPAGESAMVQEHRRKGSPARGEWSDIHARYYLWSYQRQVEMVDVEMERLLATVDATGRRERTMVALTSDHGEGLLHHGLDRKNTLYDESARVPLVISGPSIRAGKREDTPVVGYDLVPTFCRLAGVTLPGPCSGRDVSTLLRGEDKLDRFAVVTEAIGDHGRMVRSPEWKYIIYRDQDGTVTEQLFDFRNDSGETTDFSQRVDCTAILDQHRAFLRQHLTGLDPDPRVGPVFHLD